MSLRRGSLTVAKAELSADRKTFRLEIPDLAPTWGMEVKYRVTLLVVDQRPSSIDADVMSQIGTRVTCLLDDERDIQAVLSGIPNGQAGSAQLACGLGGPGATSTRHMRQLPAIDSRSW